MGLPVAQWLQLLTSTNEGMALIPNGGTNISPCHVAWPKKKEKVRERKKESSFSNEAQKPQMIIQVSAHLLPTASKTWLWDVVLFLNKMSSHPEITTEMQSLLYLPIYMWNLFLCLDFEVHKISQLQFRKIYYSAVIYSTGENQFMHM